MGGGAEPHPEEPGSHLPVGTAARRPAACARRSFLKRLKEPSSRAGCCAEDFRDAHWNFPATLVMGTPSRDPDRRQRSVRGSSLSQRSEVTAELQRGAARAVILLHVGWLELSDEDGEPALASAATALQPEARPPNGSRGPAWVAPRGALAARVPATGPTPPACRALAGTPGSLGSRCRVCPSHFFP